MIPDPKGLWRPLGSYRNTVDRIRLRYNVPVQVDAGGGLLFGFETGQLRESAPVAWQEIAGQRVAVAVSFRLLAEREVGFVLGEYDPAYFYLSIILKSH